MPYVQQYSDTNMKISYPKIMSILWCIPKTSIHDCEISTSASLLKIDCENSRLLAICQTIIHAQI